MKDSYNKFISNVFGFILFLTGIIGSIYEYGVASSPNFGNEIFYIAFIIIGLNLIITIQIDKAKEEMRKELDEKLKQKEQNNRNA
jgi:hypothetical protein